MTEVHQSVVLRFITSPVWEERCGLNGLCTAGVVSCWCGVLSWHTSPYSAECVIYRISHICSEVPFVCTCIPLVCVSGSIHPSCMVVFEATLCLTHWLKLFFLFIFLYILSCFILIEIQLGSLSFYQTYWIIIIIIFIINSTTIQLLISSVNNNPYC